MIYFDKEFMNITGIFFGQSIIIITVITSSSAINISDAGIVSEMFIAEEDCSVEWLTSLCNLIVAQGRIPDGWSCILLLFSNGNEIQWNVDLTKR